MLSFYTIMLAFFILFMRVPMGAEQPPAAHVAYLALVLSIILPYLLGLTASVSVRVAVARPASRLSAFFFRRTRHIIAAYKALILVSFFAFRNLFLWPEFVHERITSMPFVETILQIMPFLASLGLFWTIHWAVESTLGSRRWKLREHLLFHARHVLVPMIPMVLLTGVEGLVESSQWLEQLGKRFDGAESIMLFGTLLVMFALFPVMVRFIWPVSPMPAGELRHALHTMAVEQHVRMTNILQWRTGGSVMNACMIGVFPPLRYILITDALADSLTQQEVRAVFGHELCHAKRNHVLYYGLFFISLVLLFTLPGAESTPFGYIQVPAALVAWIFIFGFISRRFERECDLFGARAVGSIPAFVSALRKISPGSSTMSKLRTFLHYGIPNRVEFLASVQARPEQAERFLSAVRLIRIAIGLLFAASVILSVAYGQW